MKHTALSLLVVAALTGAAFAASPTAPSAPTVVQAGDDDTSPEADAVAALQEERWDDAARLFGALADEQPTRADFAFHHAYCVHMTGDHRRALALHERATFFPPTRAHAFYNLACASALLGETDAALLTLRRARAAGFEDVENARKDEDVASLREDPRFEEALEWSGLVTTADLDAWIGEWTVASEAGRVLGTNHVTKALGGGAVVEHWSGANETEGTSLSFTDPRTGRWRQVWRSSTGVVGDYEGDLVDGVFRWEGRTVFPGGATLWVRTRLIPQEDGTLRHEVDHSADFGRTWKHAFTTIATPIEDDEAEPSDETGGAGEPPAGAGGR